MTDRELFEKTDFSFEILGGDEEIEIQPYIDTESDRARTLIASFQVDSLEMIESARIPLSAGKNHVPFQQTVRIVKPLLWQPNGNGVPSLYSFTVIFHQKGAPFYRIEKRVGIRFVETRPGGKFFRINGRKVRLTFCEIDCGPDGAYLTGGSNGNLVCLKDTDQALEEKLEYCGKSGLIVALELNGGIGPEHFAGQPEVCFFLAEPGSASAKRYRNSRETGLPPLFTRDELNLLMQGTD